MQLMRKCLPRIPLPVTSDQSAYSFLLPGTPAFPDVSETPGKVPGFIDLQKLFRPQEPQTD